MLPSTTSIARPQLTALPAHSASATAAVDIGYVGDRGRRGVIPVPFNQAGIATAATRSTERLTPTVVEATDSDGNPLATEPQNTYDGGNTDLRVLFIGYGINSVAYRAAGSSAYDALQAQVQKRLSYGGQFGISYTWSHSLDEQSGVGLFYNGSNPLIFVAAMATPTSIAPMSRPPITYGRYQTSSTRTAFSRGR